ncbi:MAG: PD40 domain-containing protein [Flavobacteriales bacterium]|nr:PD40 domain-containing protein [Flavobacteriales bacterium]
MNKTLITVLLLFGVSVMWGQKLSKTDKKEVKKGFVSIEFEDFIDANERFTELYKKYPNDDEVRFGLAICRLNQKSNEREALDLMENVYNTKSLENYYFYLGRAYLAHGRFEEAITSLQTILLDKKKSMDEDEIVNYLSIAYEAKELITAARKVEVNNLGQAINSSEQESVPVALPNGSGLFFTSRRADNVSEQKDHLGNYFQDVFFSKKENGTWQNPKNCTEINTKLHDAAVSISYDGSKFLFFKTNPDNIVQGDLYEANCDAEGNLSDSRLLQDGINSKSIESSACISADGNMIFFSSNRPGGYGGFDLYYAKRLPTGDWGKELNMGPLINTSGNEDAPFFHVDGQTLYFSSDGRVGIGGFDIYSTKMTEDGSWTQPENEGFPINSLGHDLYYRVSPDSRQAYLSSDRDGGYGSDDIYLVNIYDHESFKTVIRGNVKDVNGNPLNAKITIINEQDKNLNGIYRTNGKGNFILLSMPMEQYQLIIECKGFESTTIRKSFDELTEEGELSITLKSLNSDAP